MYIEGLNVKNMHKVNYNFGNYDNANNINKSIKVDNNTVNLNYSSKSVPSIIKSINNCFESDGSLVNTYYDYGDGKHLIDRLDDGFDPTNKKMTDVNKVDDPESDMASLTKDYGEILNEINSNDDLNDEDKKYLDTILDKSFDNYSDKLSQALSDKISGVLNYAANNKDEVYKKYGIKINADKIVDSDKLKQNITKMFSAAKVFYKNNPHGSDEDLDEFVNSKFNVTKDINNMSYKDLMLAKNILSDGGFNYKYKDKHDDKKLDILSSEGASDALVGNFKKAYYQNKDFKLRCKTYNDLRSNYEDGIKKLEARVESLKKTLEDLSKQAQDADKEYQYNLRDIQEKKMKAQMILNMMSDGNKDKKIENLKKDHDRTLKNISKQEAKIQGQISNILKEIKDKRGSYKSFMQDPNKAINENMQNESESSK